MFVHQNEVKQNIFIFSNMTSTSGGIVRELR